jgi:hypothetical protein
MNKYRLMLAGGTVVLLLLIAAVAGLGPGKPSRPSLQAGFAAVRITPPLGTPLSGFGDRDFRPDGAKGIHDDLYVRALYLSQEGAEVLIMGFDILFFSRDESDRFKGAIGGRLGLAPSNILLNTSHTHTGPKVGNWYYTPADPLYLNELEKRTVEAAVEAKKHAAAAGRAAQPASPGQPGHPPVRAEPGGREI